jgi:hypothetical protein
MKRKFFPAILIGCFVSPCFSQTRDYPKEIRGYKVERAAVELKPREQQQVAKTSATSSVSNNNSTSSDSPTSPAQTQNSPATPDANPNVDQLITFGAPSLARMTPLGITLNMPVIVAPIIQSGHVFLRFEDMTVNEHSIEIEEYRRGFDLPTKKPLTLREPLRFYISLPTAALAALGEGINSKEMWPVTGRVYVCGKYKKFVFSFKRCVPVELNLTMKNPLRRN